MTKLFVAVLGGSAVVVILAIAVLLSAWMDDDTPAEGSQT